MNAMDCILIAFKKGAYVVISRANDKGMISMDVVLCRET